MQELQELPIVRVIKKENVYMATVGKSCKSCKVMQEVEMKQAQLFQRVQEQRIEKRLETTEVVRACIVCGDVLCAKQACVNFQAGMYPEANEPKNLKKIWGRSGFCPECGSESYCECKS